MLGVSSASTVKNWDIHDNNVVVLSDSDNEAEIEEDTKDEVNAEEMHSDDGEDHGDAEAEGVEIVEDDEDDDDEEDEEIEEGLRIDRQRREDTWYPKSIDEIQQATRIHSGGKFIVFGFF